MTSDSIWCMAKIRKLGFLSDVHNDIEGLSRALDVLGDCDKVMHLGDLLEDAPEGNGIVCLLTSNNVEGVMGYHDELAYKIGSCLNPETKSYISGLPMEIIKGDFHLVHDNPLSKVKNEGLCNSGGYIKDEYYAGRVFEEASFKVLIVGHTHKAEQYEYDDASVVRYRESSIQLDPQRRYILNPGPVCAQSRGTEPSVGVFDFENNHFSVRKLWED